MLFQYLACIGGAGGENRTPNLLITNQLPYHWATPACLNYCLAYREGFEPSLAVLETVVLPLTLPIHVWCPRRDSNSQ